MSGELLAATLAAREPAGKARWAFASPTVSFAPWIEAIVMVARHHNLHVSVEECMHLHSWIADQPFESRMRRLAARAGLRAEILRCEIRSIPTLSLPVIAELSDGTVVVVHRNSGDLFILSIADAGMALPLLELPAHEIASQMTGRIIALRPVQRARDPRIGDLLKPFERSWFWQIIAREKWRYSEIVLAAFVSNILALGTSLFAMQVWDRVIPAQSQSTLWVLAIGVFVALCFDFVLRTMRTTIADRAGRRADLAISSIFFGRALDIRNDQRPKSTGAFITQLRDIEQLRELLTSTTVTSLVDMPFVITFLLIVASLGGPLAYILLAAIPLIILPGVLLQWPLGKLSREGMQENAIRNAMLIESIQRIEDIKALQAEARFRTIWERATLGSATISMKQRFLATVLASWTQVLQQFTYIAMVVAGAYLVMGNEMTTGALIACSILSSRAIAPLSPLAMTFTRWQHAKVAREGLDEILRKPTDHGPDRELLHRPVLWGAYRFERVRYTYDNEAPVCLSIDKLQIDPGERIAILGRIGSGKTTLLRLLAGMSLPTAGSILLDATEIQLIDPSDLRREASYLPQDARLFFGTLRENLLIGSPNATDEEVIESLRISCALPLVQGQSRGLDLQLHEGGAGLSNGQRQSVLLARTLLRQPNILLLDEPTANMDEATERRVIENLRSYTPGRTFVVSTHRLALLDIVDRIIVLDRGHVVMNGPKANVLRALSARTR